MKFNKFIISSNKILYSCFTSIPGIGLFQNQKILSRFGWDLTSHVSDIPTKRYKALFALLEIAYQRARFVQKHKESLVSTYKHLKCYKGWRHIFNLPLNGQNTHNNRSTRKRFRII